MVAKENSSGIEHDDIKPNRSAESDKGDHCEALDDSQDNIAMRRTNCDQEKLC
jgi:hypothetical protein